jgi:hypothetical protein
MLSPAGSMLGSVVGQVIGGGVGGAIGGGISGGSEALADKHSSTGPGTEAHAFPRTIMLAITNERYLLLVPRMSSWASGVKAVTVKGEKDLGWIADVTTQRRGVARRVAITFDDGSSVQVEDSRSPYKPGIAEFVEEQKKARAQWLREHET